MSGYSLEYIVQTYQKQMLFVANRILHNLHDAEDAVQRAFLRITKYIHNLEFPMSDDKLRCYAYTVVLHEVMRILDENK